MAFLKRLKKSTLVQLAFEFEIEVTDGELIKNIIPKIENAPDYDEETAKLFVERIMEEQRDLEKVREREERKADLERADREKEIERAEREKERLFELEKLKISRTTENVGSMASNPVVNDGGSRRIRLKDLVPKFDPKALDITLFFLIFESQAEKEGLIDENRVSELIPLLPAEVAELIVKEPVEKRDDYAHIKRVLLERFQLSAVALRMKFGEHQKKPGTLWKDLVYELNGYFGFKL